MIEPKLKTLSKHLLQNLKSFAGKSSLVIPVGNPVLAILRPVATQKDLLNPKDIHLLTKWRNQFTKSYFTEFIATEEQTAIWISEAIAQNPNRILFMIDDLSGRPFGSMGFIIDWKNRSVEGDAVVRGEDAPKGIMKEALKAMLNFAKENFDLLETGVRVRSDNQVALDFYFNMGFQEMKRVPVKKKEELGKVTLIEDPNSRSDLQIVYLTLK